MGTTYSGDPSTLFETSPTTRVTDMFERMLAPVNNPAASTAPDYCGPRHGRAAVRECPDARTRHRHGRNGPEATMRHLASPTARCRELTRPLDERPDSAPPSKRALSRESDADVMRITRMRGAAGCDLFFFRVDPYSSFRLSAQRAK